MGIERYRNDNPRTAEEVAAQIEADLQAINPEAPVVQGTQNYAFVRSFARTVATQQEQALSDLYDAAYITDASGEELTKKARGLGVKRQPPVTATGVIEFQRDSNATTDYPIPAGTIVGTGGDNPVRFETIEAVTLANGTSSVQADIRCTEDGPVGNVGAGTLDVLVSGSVSGVDSVSNPQATGDPSFTLTDGSTSQTSGQAEETDASLRERTLETTAVGGAGTVQAAELALENEPEVISADVKTNRSDTTVDGIDPWHTEVRVFGGTVESIADTLFDVLPLITLKTLQGGANGTSESTTIDTDLYGTLTVPITRPTETSLDITIDVVHTASYGGTDAVTDAIVGYVGGATTDGTSVTGLAQGENVLVNEVENVSEDVAGVEYADVTLLDADGDGTDDTTTDADGVPVYSVSDTEVPTVNAANITVNSTQR